MARKLVADADLQLGYSDDWTTAGYNDHQKVRIQCIHPRTVAVMVVTLTEPEAGNKILDRMVEEGKLLIPPKEDD